MPSLAAKIRARRKVSGPRRRRTPRQLQPNAIRVAYFAAVRALIRPAHDLVSERLLPKLEELTTHAAEGRGDFHEDANPGRRVNTLMQGITEAFARQVPNEKMARISNKFAERTSTFQRGQLANQLKGAIGIDIGKFEPRLAQRVKDFTAENVALIKSVPAKYFGEIEKLVLKGIGDGERHEDLADLIQERWDVAESSAKLIARDQVGKFYGELNMTRQTALGITGYIWRTSNDERVREEHADREGESFEWDDPPEDGHPGEPINCRCSAEPDLSDIVGDEE